MTGNDLFGWDYGIRDATAIIFGAVDQQNGILYIFKEIYVNNMNYEDIGKEYKKVYPDAVHKVVYIVQQLWMVSQLTSVMTLT